MREVVSRRAVRSAALLEAVELRRLLSAVLDNGFGEDHSGVVRFPESLPAGMQYDQIVSAKSANAIYTVAEIGSGAENQFVINKFTSGGEPLFATTATVLSFSETDDLRITDVVADASDSLYVAGSRYIEVEAENGDVESQTIGFIVKFTASGAHDDTFGGLPGSISTPELAFNSQNIQLVASGGMVFATYVTQDANDQTIRTATTLAFDSGGNPLSAYGTSGTATTSLPIGASVNEALLDGTGLLLIGTSGPNLASRSLYVGRLEGTGTIDTSFGAAGFGVTEPTGHEITPTGVAKIGSRFVVAGFTAGGAQIVARIASDFTLDESFDGDGIVELDPARLTLSDLDRSTRSLTADAAGNVYVAGYTISDDIDLAVVRLNSTGALDTTFNDDGVYTFSQLFADVAIGIETTASGAVRVTGFQLDIDTFEQNGLLLQLAEPVVVNNPPVVGGVTSAGTVNTGVLTTFNSSFTDADSADSFTVVWNFGDGNTQTVVSAAGAISASHAFATPGTKVVTVTVTDSSGNSASSSGTINVVTPNTPPAVAPVTGPNSVNTNVAASFSSSFADANPADTFTVTWNFGDGNTQTSAVNAAGPVSASHAYTFAGTYTVTLSVSDGVNPAVTSSKIITVIAPPAPPVPYTIAAGKLTLAAGAGADTIQLLKSGANYVLIVNGTSYPIGSTLNSAVINGGAGADFIKVSSQVTLPVTLIGGAGNDSLRGGSGNDVLVGDEGNDALVAGSGQDLLIGGVGADYLVGQDANDLLLSGTTTLSNNLAALSAVMAEWTSSHNILIKILNVTGLLPLPTRLNGNHFLTPGSTVLNDTSVDTLIGGAGIDLYFASFFGSSGDVIRDRQTTHPAYIAALLGD